MLRDFRVEFAGQEFTCVDAGFGSREIVQVVVRPEDIQVVPAIQGQLTGLVENVIFKGVHYEMHVRQAGYEWIIHSTQASQVRSITQHSICSAERGISLFLTLSPTLPTTIWAGIPSLTNSASWMHKWISMNSRLSPLQRITVLFQ